MTIKTAIRTKKKIAAMLGCSDAFLLRSTDDAFVMAAGVQFRCNAILVVPFVLNSTFQPSSKCKKEYKIQAFSNTQSFY